MHLLIHRGLLEDVSTALNTEQYPPQRPGRQERRSHYSALLASMAYWGRAIDRGTSSASAGRAHPGDQGRGPTPDGSRRCVVTLAACHRSPSRYGLFGDLPLFQEPRRTLDSSDR